MVRVKRERRPGLASRKRRIWGKLKIRVYAEIGINTFMPRSGLCRARPIIAGRAPGAAVLRVSQPRHNP